MDSQDAVLPNEKRVDEAINFSIYSSQEKAIEAFTNTGYMDDRDDLTALVDELKNGQDVDPYDEGELIYSLIEYELDSGGII